MGTQGHKLKITFLKDTVVFVNLFLVQWYGSGVKLCCREQTKPRLDWARGVSVVVQRKGQCEKCRKHERWSVWCVWKNSHFLPVLWSEGPEEPRPALLSWSGLAGSTLCWVGLLTLLQERSPRPLRHLLPFTLFGLTSPGPICVLMLPAFLYHHPHLLREVSFFPNS